MTTPLLGLSEISEGVANQATIHNTALRQIESGFFRVLSMTETTPAVGAAESDSYIIPTGATGVWAGKETQIARWIGGAWSYFEPFEGLELSVVDEMLSYTFYGSAWEASGGAGTSAPFADTTALIKGSADATKQAKFEVDGFTTATTRTITLPNKSGTMAMLDDIPELSAQPFDVHAFYPGVPSASAKVLRIPVARAVTFPDDFAGAYGKASAAATGSTAFDVQKNGASVGTITFAAAATTATFVTSGTTVVLAAGDVLSIIAPVSPDATLADVGFVLAGTR